MVHHYPLLLLPSAAFCSLDLPFALILNVIFATLNNMLNY